MPLKDDMKLAGRACTILEHNVYEATEKPFGLLDRSTDQLKEDEIYIATGAGNSALGRTPHGDSQDARAVGAVLDGYT